MANIIKALGLQNASVGKDPFSLRAPKKISGLFGSSLLNFGGSRRRQNSRPAPRNSRPGNDQLGRSGSSFSRAVLRGIAIVVFRLLVLTKDVLVESTRCAIYSARRRMALIHATSKNPTQRAFGRATLDYCAAQLQRRTNRFLVPGGRVAQRLVRCALAAAETALTAHDLSDAQGAKWISTFAKYVDVTLLFPEDNEIKPAAARPMPRALREREVTEAIAPLVVTQRSAETDSTNTSGLRLQRRSLARRGPRDVEYIPVQPAAVSVASEPEEPQGFSFGEDDDPEIEAQVLDFLREEQVARNRPLDEGHDGF